MSERPPRVLVTKIGLDGHDRGSRIVCAALRDAGMEVIYTGPWQEIPDVVKIAAEEDVDVIGVSSLASDHLLMPKLMEALREADLGHVAVVLGGTIPESDEKWLREARVERIFHPGTPLPEIVKSIGQLALEVRARDTLA
ncbi:MAG: cobalamin B12-binding domain-containing protein [SAR324 cluster bacterium]|nr:cobalamin B12-binding domain-containing protein [SAR324 cluster bacterium]